MSLSGWAVRLANYTCSLGMVIGRHMCVDYRMLKLWYWVTWKSGLTTLFDSLLLTLLLMSPSLSSSHASYSLRVGDRMYLHVYNQSSYTRLLHMLPLSNISELRSGGKRNYARSSGKWKPLRWRPAHPMADRDINCHDSLRLLSLIWPTTESRAHSSVVTDRISIATELESAAQDDVSN
jgi:hypothetical protein